MTLTDLLESVRRVEVHTNRHLNASADGARLCEPQPSRFADSRKSFERVLLGEAAAGRRPALRAGARASARFTIRKPAASNPIIRLTSSRTLKRRERRAPVRSVPVCRNSNPIEFDGVGNCGEFAIIKSQADEPNRFFNSLEFDGIRKAYQPVKAQLSHEPTKKNRH